MIEKIPHLKALGVTAIELLPIYEFDESEWKLTNPLTGENLFNYWGYSPLSFFAPMQRYGTTSDPIETARELKCLIEACHDENIAVILDVVYNHTGEGNERGPAYSLKLLDENTYYIMDEDSTFANYSGCGNTLNANHPIVEELILNSLRHWASEYRIDGFRFDLASALTRSQTGSPMTEPSIMEAIIKDPIVGKCLLIVEPWDAAGLHQTGRLFNLNQCHQPAMMEWNDRFRDDVRRFIKGDRGMSGAFASRLCGSEDIYGPDGAPRQSVNYITAHDGFSLYDLVSYHAKHNLPNGEQNRDGMNENVSWNCGEEGRTEKHHVLHLRDRQVKNFLVALFLSQGNPMMLLGDECHRTKLGNNNTWCQDTPISWLNWDQVAANQELTTLISLLIKIRKESGCFSSNRFLTPEDIEWHGTKAWTPRWNSENHLVACTLNDADHNPRLFLAFNASPSTQDVEIPKYPSGSWHLVLNTARPLEMVLDWNALPRITRHTFEMVPYSSMILYRTNTSSYPG
jgi:isoamylase/glycogen operon protein